MWYAIIFASFLGTQQIQIDLENEFANRVKCLTYAEKNATELYNAMEENRIGPIIQPINIFYSCKYIPYRKS